MKKLKSLFLFVLLLSVFGCGQNDIPIKTSTIEAALVDAAAGGETYLSLVSSCPPCATNPWTIGAMGAVAATVAAEASGLFGGKMNQPNSNGKINNISLKNEYLLSNNNAEIVGVNHNILLNSINKENNKYDFRIKFESYDETTWLNLLDKANLSGTLLEKKTLISNLKSSNILGELISNTGIYEAKSNSFETYLIQSKLNPQSKNDLSRIVTEYKNVAQKGDGISEVNIYLNQEIEKRIKVE